jgi:hypothetical protein
MRTYKARRAAAQQARQTVDRILGDVAHSLKAEQDETVGWAKGSRGERKFALAIADVPRLNVLHDRRVQGTRGNIDHLLVGPAGVFVVDSKNRRGVVQVRDVGGLFGETDLRLIIRGRDRSKLARDMEWQVQAVKQGLINAGVQPLPPVIPVLCFVASDYPLLWPAEEFQGVRLESIRTIKELVVRSNVLDSAAIDRIHRVLATAFPPK